MFIKSLETEEQYRVFLNDFLLAAAIISSGNNYSKFSLPGKTLGLSIISSNTFTRLQKHAAAPVVKENWDKMNALITGILQQYHNLCLCGDDRNDSPGHSITYCVYMLMEHAIKGVVNMAVIDKRRQGVTLLSWRKKVWGNSFRRWLVSFPSVDLQQLLLHQLWTLCIISKVCLCCLHIFTRACHQPSLKSLHSQCLEWLPLVALSLNTCVKSLLRTVFSPHKPDIWQKVYILNSKQLCSSRK